MEDGLHPVLKYWRLTGSLLALVIGLALYAAHLDLFANILISLISLIAIIPLILDMVRTLLRGEFGIDLLAIVAVTASLMLGEYIAAIAIVVMMTTGEALEDYAQEHARGELHDLLDRAPKIAHIWHGKHTADIPVGEVKPGDELMVKPGETIPVDAVITEGASSVDESAITGESLPVSKDKGDELLSGSINTNGLLRVNALRTSHASQYEQIVQLVQDAASSRSPLVRLADRYSVPFTALAFTIAGFAWAASGDALHALEVLVVATPCPLLIATPVAIVSGMSLAAKNGIIVKSGAALERLARVRSIAFDKTGTLSRGVPAVDRIEAVGVGEDELLATAAAIESNSGHILAAAIVAASRKRRLKLPAASGVHEDPGHGIKAQISGKSVVAGRASYLDKHGVTVPESAAREQTASYLAIDGKYAGAILFTDTIRPETKPTLRSLKRLGIEKTIMLTGDHEAVAARVAHEAGITDYKAGCLPADKVRELKRIDPRWHPVAMVGDGVNDAPTLAASDVGIALGAKGSTAASESADVVIMLDDLGRVPAGIRIARHALRIALQSIWTGMALSVVLMLVATTGLIKPVYGAVLQEIVDVIVILNALRARTMPAGAEAVKSGRSTQNMV